MYISTPEYGKIASISRRLEPTDRLPLAPGRPNGNLSVPGSIFYDSPGSTFTFNDTIPNLTSFIPKKLAWLPVSWTNPAFLLHKDRYAAFRSFEQWNLRTLWMNC